MSQSKITQRFLECLDLLVKEGKVRSKRGFAIAIGYHPQGLSEMAAHRREVPLDLIEKSVEMFHLNPHYLFTGKGQPISSQIEDDGLRLKHLSIVTDQQGDERIVHVPYPAQAGYGQLINDPTFFSELPTYQLPDPQFRSGTYRSFEIAGTSMEPTFRPNDIVIASFIEPRYWEQAIKNAQIYIIVTHHDVLIKRVQNRLKVNAVLECCSDNGEYETYTIQAEDIREVWKARLKMTSHLDAPTSRTIPGDISEQLNAQQKMLEHLTLQLNLVKTS